ncbi:hypothetical protein [Methylobacterium oxalidis]|uniref:Glycine zipper domain-containing protein n=1 Tax=Methylobacterium oxalidis TaxID=944322 RepID=A0A512J3R3_9HYPH|nr:hypothetical protein [Methylobacterium oxalidis]GEP04595.1 hypothetical protein MOX02_26330 [Methylobacterium oxalidis]GJE30991.1 hypothetical protein LDDCCGHA_1163 [Methylobacterium oxalidis]GLS62717.1 hypothetical protein GCM10007888_10980 [Methylobacterium oxalidis]
MKLAMKAVCFGLMLAAAGAAPRAALAGSSTTIGVGSGAVAGAIVGGPIGAVAGAVIGGVVGSSRERASGRRYRRVRAYRRSRAEAAPVRRYVQRGAEPAASSAAQPSLTPRAPSQTGSVSGTAWKDPR